ncbi:breast cancer metastasis-suppressor 1-like protein [Hyla sarda]|uniref:breast cancer metastasis-suppressor 1-like protein n=1 Tax=Hyla sarda TaxID=327740 RepID=UPI0024C42791|nr:breast cancer metastasis-suppressor 1-like protein [Hyla sarda]
MPVHSREKKESNHNDMEVDYPENEGSSSEDEDTDSSSGSEEGDTSEMDDEDCERRRMECLDEMSNLEKQFTDLKDQLYKERLSQVDAKLQEVIAGKAPEYLEPLAALQENMQIRTKVAGTKHYAINIWRRSCSGLSASWCDITWQSVYMLPEASLTCSRPYIVYMLQDLDILEDWTTIRKAMATLGPHRVKAEGDILPHSASRHAAPDMQRTDTPSVTVKMEKHQFSARSEDGRLHYNGEWYGRGQTICIDKKDEYPTSAIITTVNSDEVWFKRPDGSKSKLYISQLQKGKYSIKHI